MPTAPTIDYSIAIDANTGSQRIDYEYSNLLVHQRESAYPFTAFMVKMAMEKSLTSVIYWFETRPAPEQDLVNGAVAQGGGAGQAVSVVVDNPKYFKPNDVIEFPNTTVVAGSTTNMGFVVSVTVGTSTLSVKPYDPALIMAALADNETINILFTSYEQGSTTTTSSLTRPIRGTNASTILRDSYTVTKTYENERLFAAPERARARAEKEIRHLVDLNKLLMFGKLIAGSGDTSYASSGNLRTQTQGFENFITTNVFHYGAALTSDLLFDYMTQIHENSYGADGAMDTRIAFCSSKFLSFINKMTLQGVRFTNVPSTWGANITRLEWAGWKWDLVHDPVLTKFRQGAAFVFQPRYIRYRPFRPTQFRANVQNPENDYVKDEFLTEPNFEVKLEELHSIIYA